MQTRNKVALAVTAMGIINYLYKQPRIKVIVTDAARKVVSYTMSVAGRSMADTFAMGDEPNIIAVGDGFHYYAAKGNPLTGIVELHIGHYKDGGFISDKGYLVSFSGASISGERDYPKLRSVKVTYSNGDVVETSMAAHLTDSDIREYFRVGRKFNLGSGEHDLIAAVTDVEILE